MGPYLNPPIPVHTPAPIQYPNHSVTNTLFDLALPIPSSPLTFILIYWGLGGFQSGWVGMK